MKKKTPNIKYKVPISLALDDKNHLSCHSVGCFTSKNNELLLTAILAPSALEEVENNDFCVKLNKITNFTSVTTMYLFLYK